MKDTPFIRSAGQVTVTRDNIDKGDAKSCTNCMIARALWEKFEKPRILSAHRSHGETVFTEFPYFVVNGAAYSAEPWVAEKMYAYDIGAPVEPFSFELYEINPVPLN